MTSAIEPEKPATVALASTTPDVVTANVPENVHRGASCVPWHVPETDAVVLTGVGVIPVVPPPPHAARSTISSADTRVERCMCRLAEAIPSGIANC